MVNLTKDAVRTVRINNYRLEQGRLDEIENLDRRTISNNGERECSPQVAAAMINSWLWGRVVSGSRPQIPHYCVRCGHVWCARKHPCWFFFFRLLSSPPAPSPRRPPPPSPLTVIIWRRTFELSHSKGQVSFFAASGSSCFRYCSKMYCSRRKWAWMFHG